MVARKMGGNRRRAAAAGMRYGRMVMEDMVVGSEDELIVLT